MKPNIKTTQTVDSTANANPSLRSYCFNLPDYNCSTHDVVSLTISKIKELDKSKLFHRNKAKMI